MRKGASIALKASNSSIQFSARKIHFQAGVHNTLQNYIVSNPTSSSSSDEKKTVFVAPLRPQLFQRYASPKTNHRYFSTISPPTSNPFAIEEEEKEVSDGAQGSDKSTSFNVLSDQVVDRIKEEFEVRSSSNQNTD